MFKFVVLFVLFLAAMADLNFEPNHVVEMGDKEIVLGEILF